MHAIVVGSGPVGLASALLLQKRGWDVTVIDQRTEFTRPQIVMLNPPTVTQLALLGVTINGRAINSFDLDISLPFKESLVQQKNDMDDATESEMISYDLEGLNFKRLADINQKGFKVVPIRELQSILLQKALEVGIKMKHARVMNLICDASEKYCLQVRDEDGEQKTVVIEPDLIVLAEGKARNLVRNSLGIKVKQLSPKVWCTLRVHQIEKDVLQDLRSTFKIGYDQEYQEYVRCIAVCDQDGGRCAVGVTLPPQLRATKDEAKIKEFCLKKSECFFGGRVRSLPIVGGSFTPFSFQEELSERCHSGANLVIVGDAARSGSFFSGLGTNMGISIDVGQCLNAYLDSFESASKGVQYTKHLRGHAVDYHKFNKMIAYDSLILHLFASWHRLKAFIMKRFFPPVKKSILLDIEE
ncbi:hypothetical protein MIR68_000800 [Amoeboaphelidium protococcarum]|nr:hypothetical protein MIR68_000800 [Amoeboaphelidium protococcarum]